MTIAAINHIEITGSEPRKFIIAGTQIEVEEIVTMHLHNNCSIGWIVDNFDLTHGQIYAALAYYYDHQAEIDQRIRERAVRTETLLKQVNARSVEELINSRRR